MMGTFETNLANLNKGFAVAIQIEAKAGEGDAVAKILENLMAPSMNEEKVKFFLPYRSPENPLSFFVYELYEDRSGWDAHNNSEHFLAAIDDLVSRCAKRQRVPFIPYFSLGEA
ncbi:MAG: quinol monooxygenase YgiN [Alphaproteobacteria bacterium]|jgi:quinol monooxygenase YgiN